MRPAPESDHRFPGPPPPGPDAADDADARFRRWVLGLHQLLPVVPGYCRDCSCGSPAVLCAYLRAAHDLLGYPMPWAEHPYRHQYHPRD